MTAFSPSFGDLSSSFSSPVNPVYCGVSSSTLFKCPTQAAWVAYTSTCGVLSFGVAADFPPSPPFFVEVIDDIWLRKRQRSLSSAFSCDSFWRFSCNKMNKTECMITYLHLPGGLSFCFQIPVPHCVKLKQYIFQSFAIHELASCSSSSHHQESSRGLLAPGFPLPAA